MEAQLKDSLCWLRSWSKNEVTTGACKNEYVDLTMDHEENNNKASPTRLLNLFGSVEEKKMQHLSATMTQTLAESDQTKTEKVEFIGTGNKKQNVSIVNKSD